MVFVECSIMDMETNKIKGKYSKSFDLRHEFNSWYKMVKADCDTIINIMSYNPYNSPGQKITNDVKLLRVSRRGNYEI